MGLNPVSDPRRSVLGVDNLEVTLEAGVPVAFERGGRTWRVGVDPVRWYERVPWWQTSKRMERGAGRMDVEVWQVQARIGHNPRTPLVTFELVRGQDREAWSVRSMEAVAA